MSSKIKVRLHASVASLPPFNSLHEFMITKIELFKYGALNIIPPSHVTESDFDYLQGKVPGLHILYDDYLSMEPKRIVSYASGETATRLHEVVGVGVAIAYSLHLLKINPNIIFKIPPAKGGAQFLDFRFTTEGKKYELECRGTIHSSNVSGMLSGILSKKAGKADVAIRFGGVTLLRKLEDVGDTTLLIGDDNQAVPSEDVPSMRHYFEYYQSILSLILDPKYYNSYVKNVSRTKAPVRLFRAEKIKGTYMLNNRLFRGAFFDRRLVISKVEKLLSNARNTSGLSGLSELFQAVTSLEGKHKFFLGLEANLLDALSRKQLAKVAAYQGRAEILESAERQVFADRDGVLFVHDKLDKDPQISSGLPEEEVSRRLRLIYSYVKREPHRCGAPCRSLDRRGKPCEVMTYASNCHFHR